MKPILAAIAVALTLTGCADQMLSNDRIRSNTAMALGVPDGAVTIADRRYDGATNTYFVARAEGHAYRCLINGGGLLAMGLTNPVQCTRK